MPQWDAFIKGLRRKSVPTVMQVMMLGARGVGKTSLLTSMHEQLQNTVNTSHLLLTPDQVSAMRLGERLGELKRLPETFEVTGGIPGNLDFRDYIFGMGRIDKKPDMNLLFTDCPGGALTSGASRDQMKRLGELVHDCEVVVIAIDAPALMEELIPEYDKEGRMIKVEGKWNQLINKPFEIAALFKNHYPEIEGNRLVLLVPVKCERYLEDPRTAEYMRRLIKESYRELFAFLRTRGQQVAIAITPVQTVGSVKFSHITTKQEGQDELPVFEFRRFGIGGYRPKDNEQPLRYLLRFFLREYHRARMTGAMGLLNFLFGRYEYLLEAADILQKGCKDQSDPSCAFEIIQGDSLL